MNFPMKILSCLLAGVLIASCAPNYSDRRESPQDKMKAKLKSRGYQVESSMDINQTRLLIQPEKTPSGIFRTTIMIDPDKNPDKLSIKEITAMILALANASGFSTVDCPQNQMDCFRKEDVHLSIADTDSPGIIRLEIVKEKTALQGAVDTVVKFFFEALLQYIQQLPRH